MAAKKQLTPEQLKAAKQKKIAIGGAVLLVAILAFEVPKTLKTLNAKPPAAAAATTTPAVPATTTPAAPSTPSGAAPAATPADATGGSNVDSIVVNADLSPTPLEGQLTNMTATFTTKDPFRQQLGPSTTSTTPAGATGTTGAKKKGGSVVPGTGTGTGTATTGPSTPAASPTSAVISINGVDSPVDVAGDFPATQPLFHLVSLTANAAKISIAGGSLSSGAPAITLRLNVPTTLMNTADGTRYTLILRSTSASAAPTTPAPTVPSTTTTPTTTTPATTTP